MGDESTPGVGLDIFHGRQLDRMEHKLDQLLAGLASLGQEIRDMATALDAAIQATTDAVTAENTVIQSAVTLINGIGKMVSDAVAAALAAGATPAELQALTDVQTAISTNSAALAAAVAAGTPTPPPPQTKKP